MVVLIHMVKKQKNFSIDADLLQELKHKAVEYNLTDGELICMYIQQGLQRDSNQTTLDWLNAIKLVKKKI